MVASAVGKTAVQLRERWEGMTLEQRRALILAVIAGGTIGPGVRGRNRFDADWIAVEWRV